MRSGDGRRLGTVAPERPNYATLGVGDPQVRQRFVFVTMVTIARDSYHGAGGSFGGGARTHFRAKDSRSDCLRHVELIVSDGDCGVSGMLRWQDERKDFQDSQQTHPRRDSVDVTSRVRIIIAT